ncbi:hypothetical protein QJS04_geneDACA005360 [Acorus gramineus]|uniref:SAM domain-containing protein n=1 Tax=Acorus gramineus TaxID=55184 RepID=A0AAV9AZB0_ACOGR|nr:hypothetical protein QJS04_geneDACA005360 [Acorus gramineus]
MEDEYWFEWLSKTALDPSLVYDYAMTLSHNELSEEDIKHFDHDFLLSMGISVAKHRLEILKLAKKNQQQQHNLSMRLVKAVEKTKRRIAKAFAHRSSEEEGEGSIVVVPKASYGWREGVLKRYKKPILLKKGRLMITDGGGIRIVGGGSSPLSVVAGAETATEEIRFSKQILRGS